VHALKQAVRSAPRDLRKLAARIWEIAPIAVGPVRAAYHLPNQLERVTGTVFASLDEQVRTVRGGFEVAHSATRGFLLKNAWLLDGVLYKAGASRHLHPRASRLPRFRAEREIDRGAIFCTWTGNRYLFNWFADDCVTYALAAAEGEPVTIEQTVGPHAAGYEAWLGMQPTRVRSAFFHELVVFEDVGQNRSKHARFRAIADKLAARVEGKPHPGVFIVRGQTGDRRILRDELELADRLRARRGFRVVDPAKAGVPAIIEACAGARVVAGIEGSGLIHGVSVLLPGGSVLLLQPPNRFCSVYKDLTDRDQQQYAFVVGFPEGNDFRVDPDEVERTLDLLPP
jgi:hypothetical protein